MYEVIDMPVKLLVTFLLVFTFFNMKMLKAKEPEDKLKNLSPAVEVSIVKYKFIPPVVEVKLNQKVRWLNREKRQYHSVWFEKSGGKESDYLFPGDSYEKTFIEKGEFEYRCGPHPEMVARVIVR